MNDAVRCSCCGAFPVCAVDGGGLQVHAFVVWCENCNKSHQKLAFSARGLTLRRAIELWNDNTTKALQS